MYWTQTLTILTICHNSPESLISYWTTKNIVMVSQIKVSSQKYLRWDHADLTGNYSFTGTFLSIILKELDMVLLEHENHTLGALILQNHIDKAYEKIVEDLRSAAECSVPQHQKNFYKLWWSQELDCLKQASINSNRLWLAAGKPCSGPIFNDRQSCRMAYRKRLRDEQRNETSSYTNALHDALIQKRDRLSGNAGDRNLPLLVVVLKSMVVLTRRSLPTILATALRKFTSVMIKHGLTSWRLIFIN